MYYECCRMTDGICIPRAAVTGNSNIRRNLDGSRWPVNRVMIWHQARSTVS